MLTQKILENEIINLPGVYLWKNTNSELMGISPKFLNLLKIRSFRELVGRNDRQLPWAENAERYLQADKVSLEGFNHTGCEPFYFRGKELEFTCRFLVTKVPIYSNDHSAIIGLFANCQMVSDPNIETTNSNHTLSLPKMGKLSELSARELDCARQVVLGHTAREIADILCVSSRTVEFHIKNIKEKLGCAKKSELIHLLVMLFGSTI